MRRKITEALEKWGRNPNGVCLLVKGARQVGKTYAIEEFASRRYRYYLRLDFINNPDSIKLFEGSLEFETLLARITSAHPEFKAVKGESILFLDEIQRCPEAKTAIKPLVNSGKLDVIASGSLLGVQYSGIKSEPVGYVHEMELRSMDFEEFMWAMGFSGSFIESLRNSIRKKEPLDPVVLDNLNAYLRNYIAVGGMPKAVEEFSRTHSYSGVASAQKDITDGYITDILSYTPKNIREPARRTFLSIPRQLGARNNRFRFTEVEDRKKVGIREYEDPIQWLKDAGVAQICRNLSEIAQPLKERASESIFKIYMKDTGLLVHMLESDSGGGVRSEIVSGSGWINIGPIMENEIAEMLTKNGHDVFYYEKKGKSELDFIISLGGKLAAIEVKSGRHTESRSMIKAKQENSGVSRWIMFEPGNIRTDENGIEHYPLFCAAFMDCIYDEPPASADLPPPMRFPDSPSV